MKILTKPKSLIKSALVGGSAVVMLASPLAFANGLNNQAGGSVDVSHGRVVGAAYTQGNNYSWQANVSSQEQLSCSGRQQILNQVASITTTNDQKKLKGLNIVLSGIQTYVSSGSVSVSNYAALNSQATTDQATVTGDISAISAPQLNCNEPSSWASAQASFNNSIQSANTALNTYKSDVTKLFNAVVNS